MAACLNNSKQVAGVPNSRANNKRVYWLARSASLQVTLTLSWDESELRLRVGNCAPGKWPVLMSQAFLCREDAGGHLREEEMLMPPRALVSKTAENMFAALLANVTDNFEHILSSGVVACLTLAADSVSANYKIVKYLIQHEALPDTCLVLWNHCLQHQVAICVADITKRTHVLGPLFCTSKILQSATHVWRLRGALSQIVGEELIIEHRPPNEEDRQRAELLLNLCYLERGDLDDIEDASARRAEAVALLSILNGDWCDATPRHWCCGCCESREQTVSKVVEALMSLISTRVEVPALNRWTQVHPLISVITILILAHGLFPRAELLLRGRHAPEDNVADDDEEDALEVNLAL